jgi:hypothetical protein
LFSNAEKKSIPNATAGFITPPDINEKLPQVTTQRAIPKIFNIGY